MIEGEFGVNLNSSIQIILGIFIKRICYLEKVTGLQRMPWRQKAMKDVASCDKLRGVAHTLWSGDVRMGEPAGITGAWKWIHSFQRANGGKWNISVPSGKEIKWDSLSSGERTGRSLNPLYVKDSSLCTEGVMGLSGTAGTVPRSYKIRF